LKVLVVKRLIPLEEAMIFYNVITSQTIFLIADIRDSLFGIRMIKVVSVAQVNMIQIQTMRYYLEQPYIESPLHHQVIHYIEVVVNANIMDLESMSKMKSK